MTNLEKKEFLTIKSFFDRNAVKKKFEEMLGKRSGQFITSVLQIASSNDLLSTADPISIYNSAAVAATLDLPLNNNLGFAYIVPFKTKQKDGTYKVMAQFQLGYKGFIQLAQRSGQFKTISSTPIYGGQLISTNPLTGFEFDFTKKESEKIVGYAAYFSLINGFEKTLYMTIEDVSKHAGKFSQTYKRGFGLWKDEFDSMATKTVLKLLLSKFAPLSIEMQTAVTVDQSVLKDDTGSKFEYVDHEDITIDKKEERITLMLKDANTVEDLESISSQIELTIEQLDLFNERKEALSGRK